MGAFFLILCVLLLLVIIGNLGRLHKTHPRKYQEEIRDCFISGDCTIVDIEGAIDEQTGCFTYVYTITSPQAKTVLYYYTPKAKDGSSVETIVFISADGTRIEISIRKGKVEKWYQNGARYHRPELRGDTRNIVCIAFQGARQLRENGPSRVGPDKQAA